eukprot:CAMPEP_0195287546 /NCGR_PEP_ID=MMETSP0707-20130614/4558_1 /TAXON_ID=33640 /ORGANISM="Asterionellopsis glacialis, Strain CCMP134" /LENGTH=1384 /DNA_ID=CAMNT_0040347309 /DNA_START=177 /DNA_END=4331 /DNA_ORIENTATION=+
MPSEESENGGYSRSEWTSLSIQDRIKAMNQIQDTTTTEVEDEPELDEEEQEPAVPSSRSPSKRRSVLDIWAKRSNTTPAAPDESEDDNDSDFVAGIAAPPVPAWKKTGKAKNTALPSPAVAASPSTPMKRSSVADLWAERANGASGGIKKETEEESDVVEEVVGSSVSSASPKRNSVADLWAQRAGANTGTPTISVPLKNEEPKKVDLVIEPSTSSDAGVSDTIQVTPMNASNLWKKEQEAVEEYASDENDNVDGEVAASIDWPTGDEESDRESLHQDTIPRRSNVIDAWAKRASPAATTASSPSLPPTAKGKKSLPSLSSHFAETAKAEQTSSSVADGVKSPPWVTAKRVGSSGGASVSSMPNTFNHQSDSSVGSGSNGVPPYKQVLRKRANSMERKASKEVKSPPWLKRHEDNSTPQKEDKVKPVDTVKSPPWVNNKVLRSTPTASAGVDSVKSPPWKKKEAESETDEKNETTAPVTPSSPFRVALKKRTTTPPVKSGQKDSTPSWVKKRLEKEKSESKDEGEEKKVDEVVESSTSISNQWEKKETPSKESETEKVYEVEEETEKSPAVPATKKFMNLAKKWESQTKGSATTPSYVKKSTSAHDSTDTTDKESTSVKEKDTQSKDNWESFQRFDSGLLEADEWQSFGADFAQRETVTAESSKDIWRPRDNSPSEKKEDSDDRAESPFTAMASKRTNSWQEVETRPSRDTADKITTNSELQTSTKIKPLPSPPKLQWKSQNAHKRAQLREASPAKVNFSSAEDKSATTEKASERGGSSDSDSHNIEGDGDNTARLGASPIQIKSESGDKAVAAATAEDEDIGDPPIVEYPEDDESDEDNDVVATRMPCVTPGGSMVMAKSDEKRKALRKLRRTMNNRADGDDGSNVGSTLSDSVYSDSLMPKTSAFSRSKQQGPGQSSNNPVVQSNARPVGSAAPVLSNSKRDGGTDYPSRSNPTKSDTGTEVSGFSGASSIPNSAFATSNEDSKSDVSSTAGFSALANRATQALKSRRTSRMAAVAMQNDEEYKRELSRKALGASAPRASRRQLYSTPSRKSNNEDRDIDSPFDEREDMQRRKTAATSHIPRQTLASRYNTASRFLDVVSSMVDDAKKTFIGEETRSSHEPATELNRSLMSSSFGSYETGSTSAYPRDNSLATESQSYFDGNSIEIAPSQSTDYMTDGQSMASGAVNTSAISAASPRRTPSSRRSRGGAQGIQISEDAIPRSFVEESSNNFAEAQEAYKAFTFQQIATDTISEIKQAIPNNEQLDELAKGVNDGVQAASQSLRKLVDTQAIPENQAVPDENLKVGPASVATSASKSLKIPQAPKQDSYDEEAVAIEVEYMEEEGEQASGQTGKENDPTAAPAGESSVEMDSLGENGKSRLYV